MRRLALENLTTEINALGFPDVTVSIVPFFTTATDAITFDATDTAGISAYLNALTPDSLTYFAPALDEAAQTLNELETANGEATNLVYFLSDGVAFDSNADITASATTLHANAQVSGIGVGSSSSLVQLDLLDNTSGAEQVTDTSALNAALLGSPIPSGTLLDADIFVFDSNNVLTNSIDLDPTDFTETVLGLELDIANVSGLDIYDGDINKISLVVELDDDNDGISDLTLTSEVNIEGVLPDSFDIV